MTATQQKPFTPGDSYRREDGILMVEVKPGIYVNETTARLKQGIVPKKTKVELNYGPSR